MQSPNETQMPTQIPWRVAVATYRFPLNHTAVTNQKRKAVSQPMTTKKKSKWILEPALMPQRTKSSSEKKSSSHPSEDLQHTRATNSTMRRKKRSENLTQLTSGFVCSGTTSRSQRCPLQASAARRQSVRNARSWTTSPVRRSQENS